MKITIDSANVKIENGRMTIDVKPDEAQKLMESLNLSNKVRLDSIPVGGTFKIGKEEFIVLDKDYQTGLEEHISICSGSNNICTYKTGEKSIAVIRKDLMESKKFGENSDWRNSNIRSYLKKYLSNNIIPFINEDNVKEFNRDLTSLDGLDDYGMCIDKISLLSADEYRKYHKVLGLKSNYSSWWWTITPISTPSNDYSRGVCFVGSGGILNWDGCGFCHGVRPFLVLESSTLVTCNNE